MGKETTTFVRNLAHNDATIRQNAFKTLCQFLASKSDKKFELLDAEKLWRGLYFSMWYCDKPIPQQSLASNFGKLYSEVIPDANLDVFHEAFWLVMAREWPSLDKWRLDKFYMLVRRVVRHLFFRLHKTGWNKTQVKLFLAVLARGPLSTNFKFPQALAYHVCDIYLDELEYVIFLEFRDVSQEDGEDDDEDEDEDDSESESEAEDEDEGDSENKSENASDHEEEAPLEESEEVQEKKQKIVDATPVALLITPFEALAETGSVAARTKCREEVLDDPRLGQWGVKASNDDDDDDDGEGEWTGFGN